MNEDFYSRSYGIFGDSLEKIVNSHIAVVGLGGVGGAMALALARGGVGKLTLIDGDEVAPSNLNRQAVAFRSSVGMTKVDACARLIKDINPEVELVLCNSFWDKESTVDLSQVDFIADAIDSVGCKADLIEFAHKNDIPIISAMGAGNKVDPTAFKVADIAKTKVDPLAKVMRRLLKERNILHTTVVYSEEEAREPFSKKDFQEQKSQYSKRKAPASCSLCLQL